MIRFPLPRYYDKANKRFEVEQVLFGAEAGIVSEGVAQVHDGMGNPLVIPVRDAFDC